MRKARKRITPAQKFLGKVSIPGFAGRGQLEQRRELQFPLAECE